MRIVDGGLGDAIGLKQLNIDEGDAAVAHGLFIGCSKVGLVVHVLEEALVLANTRNKLAVHCLALQSGR